MEVIRPLRKDEGESTSTKVLTLFLSCLRSFKIGLITLFNALRNDLNDGFGFVGSFY